VEFETPTENQSVEDLKERYGISKQTLYLRKKSAHITGVRVKGMTFFTPEEVWCFDQVATLCERGMTLKEIEKLVAEWKGNVGEGDLLTPSKEAPFEVGGAMPKAPNHARAVAESASGLSVIAEREEQAKQLARAFTSAVSEALQDTRGFISDPLRQHRLLAEASREEWVLTNQQLGEVCGVSPDTITGWRPSTLRCGFVLTAIANGHWEVKKATHDEVVKHAEASRKGQQMMNKRQQALAEKRAQGDAT